MYLEALAAFFYFWGLAIMVPYQDLKSLLTPGVEALGCELLALEFVGSGKGAVLRLYIDREEGISVEDCTDVSRYVSGILEVEDPISGSYSLEVSSPGADRPLVTEEHFARYLGSQASLTLNRPADGRRNFKGEILEVKEGQIQLKVDREVFQVELANIKKASLVPEYD